MIYVLAQEYCCSKDIDAEILEIVCKWSVINSIASIYGSKRHPMLPSMQSKHYSYRIYVHTC